MMIKRAKLSDCLRFRRWLTRQWDSQKPFLVTCMANPSTADAIDDDPTILNLCKFARSWGFGGIYVVNQFAFRSSKPLTRAQMHDECLFGPDNLRDWDNALIYAHRTTGWVLAAWGNVPLPNVRFQDRAQQLGVPLKCLGVTKRGAPKHPLARGVHRIPDDQQLIDWPIDSAANIP